MSLGSAFKVVGSWLLLNADVREPPVEAVAKILESSNVVFVALGTSVCLDQPFREARPGISMTLFVLGAACALFNAVLWLVLRPSVRGRAGDSAGSRFSASGWSTFRYAVLLGPVTSALLLLAMTCLTGGPTGSPYAAYLVGLLTLVPTLAPTRAAIAMWFVLSFGLVVGSEVITRVCHLEYLADAYAVVSFLVPVAVTLLVSAYVAMSDLPQEMAAIRSGEE